MNEFSCCLNSAGCIIGVVIMFVVLSAIFAALLGA